MHIKIICHSCQHRFQRTAAQVLTEDRCPKCASSDIDVDDLGSDYPSCPACGGPGEMLGHLGNVTWWRCRDCGTDFQGRAASLHVASDIDTSEYGIFGGDGAGAWPGAYDEGYYDGYLWGMKDPEAQSLAPDASDAYKRGYRDGHADSKAGKQPRTLIEEIRSAASRRTAAPSGRSDYKPGQARMGDPTPQTDPDQFSSEDIMAEIKYLLRLNRQYGSHPLRTSKYLELMGVLEGRGFTASSSKTASAGWYATTDQMMAAAGYLSREWGDSGYSIKQGDEEGVFDCLASDGSRFQIRSDRWGNTSDVKEASRKTAQFFDDRGSKKWYFRFPEGVNDSGGGPYEAVKSNDGEYAVVNMDTNEIVASSVSWYSGPRGLWGAIEDARRWNANPALAPDTTGGNDYTGLIPGTASRHTAYSDPSVCDYCGQEGCSPTCPGPGSSGVCPQCGSNLDRNGKCSDPQGCGYGWDREDRGLTFDGEPRFAQRIATKRNQIVKDILQSNPGMPRHTAQALADEAIRRYPKAVR